MRIEQLTVVPPRRLELQAGEAGSGRPWAPPPVLRPIQQPEGLAEPPRAAGGGLSVIPVPAQRPRLLDLFCGAGGAAMGYHRAGFEVVGVDINPQPRYPFTFWQADAIEYLSDLVELFSDSPHLWEWGAIHASPPCQAYSWSAKRWDRERADLVAPTRELLQATGLPWVMENVVGAPLSNPITLCGEMFGLEVIRHRLFESDLWLSPPPHAPHRGTVQDGTYVTVAGHGGDNIKGRGSRAVKQQAMGIDWMSDVELNEAIPPAYTEWIGAQLLRVVAHD